MNQVLYMMGPHGGTVLFLKDITKAVVKPADNRN